MSVVNVSLDGEWTLVNEKRNMTLTARVPGTVFDELVESKIIADPFYGVNEHTVSWVYESEWKYEKAFFLDRDFLEKENVVIQFHGLDTLAVVSVNGNEIAETDNMHRTYEFSLKNPGRNVLKEGVNIVTVLFKSATEKAREHLERMNLQSSDPCALPGVEMLRKAYYSFGWDWGPKLPDVGIWRSVELMAWDDVRLGNFKIGTAIEFLPRETIGLPRARRVTFTLEIEADFSGEEAPAGYFYRIEIDGVGCRETGAIEFDLKEKHQTREIQIESPGLWWTHDLGDQPLYKFILRLERGNETVDSITRRTGVRKIELVREPDTWGETFYFRLNDLPIFARGANWIPTDSFIPRGKRLGKYRKTLEGARAANMNMLRVWGGGIYEDDEFYDLCDEFGLLVWQDFAFACKIQPDYPGYLENVEAEATDNIRRLRHHPSLAIWVGNNEIEEGWSNWGFEKTAPGLKTFYLEIFEKLLPRLLKEHDGTRPYWPSSPSSGGGFESPQSPDRGDSHYWMVWHMMYPFSSYRNFNSRFMSEFGFESFPSKRTIDSFCPEREQSIYSDLMENHQKNPAGNRKIFDYMKQRFSIPEEFSKQVILSQLTQAEAIEYGVEHWRRNSNDFHCMGALYWQLNDCWPVASWSSIDYYGRWKALHYFARRFYNPLYISAEESDTAVNIWLTNSLPSEENPEIRWNIVDDNGKIIHAASCDATIPPMKALMIDSLDLKGILQKYRLDELVVFFEAADKQGRVLSSGWRLFVPPANFKLKNPNLECDIVRLDNFTCELTVHAKEIALYVYLDSNSMDFTLDDNFFSMKKGETRRLLMKSDEPLPADKLNERIVVGSLYDLVR